MNNTTKSEMNLGGESCENQDTIEIPAAGPSNEQLSPPIFKLTIDTIEEICEWLSLADLLALRLTCKRFKQAVDCIISENYPVIKIGHRKIVLSICDIRTYEDGKEVIHCYNNKYDQLVQMESNDIKFIKEVEMWGETLSASDVAHAQCILEKVEKLLIGTNEIEVEFHNGIFQWCTELKCLSICKIEGPTIIHNDKTWMQRNYPTIEKIELDDTPIGGRYLGEEIVELATFFTMNPQIRNFSTTFNLLWETRNWILPSEIRFDQLDIKGDCFEEYGNVGRICDLLSTLFDRGFYKRCRVAAYAIYEQDEIDEIVSVRGMEELYMDVLVEDAVFMPRPELNQLSISYSPHFGDWNIIVGNFGNIERVHFQRAVATNIVPIIREAIKVTEIKIDKLDAGEYFENGIINVFAWNELRKQFHDAQRLTIYVEERVFLATKWTYTNTSFDKIELKRAECVNWTR